MDALGHAVITTAISDNPLAIVTSAINLRYNNSGLERLRQSLPTQHTAFAHGIASHIKANQLVYHNETFKEMKRQAAPVLLAHHIPDKFSEVAVEAVVDSLLFEETVRKEWAEKMWDSFDWHAALEYLPRFSREPERARRNILYVRQKVVYTDIEYTAQWLQRVVESITATKQGSQKYLQAVTDIACMLRAERVYEQVLREIQKALRLAFPLQT